MQVAPKMPKGQLTAFLLLDSQDLFSYHKTAPPLSKLMFWAVVTIELPHICMALCCGSLHGLLP